MGNGNLAYARTYLLTMMTDALRKIHSAMHLHGHIGHGGRSGAEQMWRAEEKGHGEEILRNRAV